MNFLQTHRESWPSPKQHCPALSETCCISVLQFGDFGLRRCHLTTRLRFARDSVDLRNQFPRIAGWGEGAACKQE